MSLHQLNIEVFCFIDLGNYFIPIKPVIDYA